MSTARAIIEGDENLKAFLRRNQLGQGGMVTQLERLGLKYHKDFGLLTLWCPDDSEAGCYEAGDGISIIIGDLKNLRHYMQIKSRYRKGKYAVLQLNNLFQFHPKGVTFSAFIPLVKDYLDELVAAPTRATLKEAYRKLKQRYHELATNKAADTDPDYELPD